MLGHLVQIWEDGMGNAIRKVALSINPCSPPFHPIEASLASQASQASDSRRLCPRLLERNRPLNAVRYPALRFVVIAYLTLDKLPFIAKFQTLLSPMHQPAFPDSGFVHWILPPSKPPPEEKAIRSGKLY